MKLIEAVNRINSELSHIQSYNEYLLDNAKRVNIFNSVVTLLTEGLADSITFSIRDRRRDRDLVRWSYNIRDESSVQRTGPDIQQIVAVLSRASQDAYIDCQPKWSYKFQSMSPYKRTRIIQDTIWATEVADFGQRIELFQDTRGLSSNHEIDLHSIESDLLKLRAESKKLINEHKISAVLDSTREMFLKGYIVGIEMTLTRSGQDLSRWKFTLRPGGLLVREGQPIEQIIAIVKSLKKTPELVIRPITTPRFDKMSSKDQSLAMKDTIWTSNFPSRSRRFLPW